LIYLGSCIAPPADKPLFLPFHCITVCGAADFERIPDIFDLLKKNFTVLKCQPVTVL
jgi:hypothetical protein